ncbi:MAG: hypothetical protein ACLPV8_21775, partial [Steroidobacteraceae bacterium]
TLHYRVSYDGPERSSTARDDRHCISGASVLSMTLLYATYALDELAAGRTPDRARLLAGALAVDRVRMGEFADPDLLGAAAELHLMAAGGTVNLTKHGRARAQVWAAAVRRLTG